jgi:hypothetical protein
LMLSVPATIPATRKPSLGPCTRHRSRPRIRRSGRVMDRADSATCR